MQTRKKSILNYVLTNSELLPTVTEIDENKQYGVFKLEKSRKTCSDCNTILQKLSVITAIEKQKNNRIVIKCGYKRYRNKLTQKQISGILEKDNSSKLL